MTAIMRTCSRNGWSFEREWKALSEREKRLWLSWDVRQQKYTEIILDTLKDQEKLTPEAFVLLANELR